MRWLAGLLLAPQNWAPANVQGVNYVPSIAAGALISAPIVNGALLAAARERVDLQPKAAALPGIAAGAVWCARPRRACAHGKLCLRGATPAQRARGRRNIGNILSILAVENPRVGYAICYPIYQVRAPPARPRAGCMQAGAGSRGSACAVRPRGGRSVGYRPLPRAQGPAADRLLGIHGCAPRRPMSSSAPRKHGREQCVRRAAVLLLVGATMLAVSK